MNEQRENAIKDITDGSDFVAVSANEIKVGAHVNITNAVNAVLIINKMSEATFRIMESLSVEEVVLALCLMDNNEKEFQKRFVIG